MSGEWVYRNQIYCCGSPQLWKSYQGVAELKRLRTAVIGGHGLGTQNEVGERLVEFCDGNNMGIMNTWFEQQKRRLYTWTSPDGNHRNQIDCILINKRWKSTIRDVRIKPGADCGIDHELLVATSDIFVLEIIPNFYSNSVLSVQFPF